MPGPARCSGPAAGIFNGLVLCAGIYGVLVGVAVAGGLGALLTCLLLLMVVLHGCLTGVTHTGRPHRSQPTTRAAIGAVRNRGADQAGTTSPWSHASQAGSSRRT